MTPALRRLLQRRSPGERLVIAVLAVLLGAALYLWLLQSAQQARLQLDAAVRRLSGEAVRLDRGAGELARLRAIAVTGVAATQVDLRPLLQAQVDGAGMSGSLARIESVDANQARLVFGSVPFADWLAWVGTLQAQHIRLDTVRIEALSTPGLVSVTATLVRPRP